MSFGFFGIQFGWGLQMANMSAIYEYLGARADQIPILWLAAPLTGMLIQPIIGHASDRTWGRLGRRRPYFLAGAILASLMLLFMPNSSALWMAAGMLWILDASINVSMEPFRAFVADILPEGQRTSGFAMQSMFIGLGAVIASALPWLLTNVFHMQQVAGDLRAVPTTTRISFYVGAAAFIGAVLWTIVTTPEYPPEDMEAFKALKAQKTGLAANAREIMTAIAEMPDTMRKLGPVQFFTWLGLFCMWLYFPGRRRAQRLRRERSKVAALQRRSRTGAASASPFTLPSASHFPLPCRGWQESSAANTRTSCACCAEPLGLMSVVVIHNKYMLLFTMLGVGIAWASTLSMPYAVLAASLPPDRTGVYMGIFNFFIVTPEICASLFFGWIMIHLLNNNRIYAIIAGGVFMLIAAALMQRVKDPRTLSVQDV